MDLAMPPMPFSAVAAPNGTGAYLFVPEEMRNSNLTYAIDLPPGVVQVIVTWQGAEPITVRHNRGGHSEIVHRIPSAASGVQRSTGVLTLVSDETHQVLLLHSTGRGDLWEQTTLDRGYVAGIQVMPMGTPADITGGGSMLRVDNSVGTRVFLGDQMIYGDTGWRNVVSVMDQDIFDFDSAGHYGARLRREGSVVTLKLGGKTTRAAPFTASRILDLPVGFSYSSPTYNNMGEFGFFYGEGLIHLTCGASPARLDVKAFVQADAGAYFGGEVMWHTDQSWPTSLPGT